MPKDLHGRLFQMLNVVKIFIFISHGEFHCYFCSILSCSATKMCSGEFASACFFACTALQARNEHVMHKASFERVVRKGGAACSSKFAGSLNRIDRMKHIGGQRCLSELGPQAQLGLRPAGAPRVFLPHQSWAPIRWFRRGKTAITRGFGLSVLDLWAGR